MNKKPLGKKQWFFLWCALSCAIVAIDQYTKILIVDIFHYEGGVITLTPFFNLVRAHNTGAAFSFLANAGGWQQWFFIGLAIIVAIVILFLLWSSSTERLSSLGLSSILGGAIGNVVDRLTYGYVVDFLDFHFKGTHFPAFNFADTAITIGVLLIIANELLTMKKKKNNTD